MTRGIAADLAGKRFGHLVALKRVENDRSNNAQWLCQCDCGNQSVVRALFLKKRQIVCGRDCKLNPARQIKDVTGQRFGKLTAVKLVGFDAARKSLWLFKCDCGLEITVPSDRVLNSSMRTCGKGVHASSYRHGLSKTRGYKSMHYMKYRGSLTRQTPKWLTEADIDAMTQVYLNAERQTKETGEPYEVDHIYPLQGKKVSGLHVPANLRIVHRSENRRKMNKLLDDVC